jgi:hypothetical protein
MRGTPKHSRGTASVASTYLGLRVSGRTETASVGPTLFLVMEGQQGTSAILFVVSKSTWP